MMRPTLSGFIKYFIIISFGYLSFPPLFSLFLSPLCYLIISPVPTCLVHNCETSQRFFYFYLLSPLFVIKFPLIPISSMKRASAEPRTKALIMVVFEISVI